MLSAETHTRHRHLRLIQHMRTQAAKNVTSAIIKDRPQAVCTPIYQSSLRHKELTRSNTSSDMKRSFSPSSSARRRTASPSAPRSNSFSFVSRSSSNKFPSKEPGAPLNKFRKAGISLGDFKAGVQAGEVTYEATLVGKCALAGDAGRAPANEQEPSLKNADVCSRV